MKLKRKVCAFIISILMVFQLCGGALAQSSYGLDKGCRNSKIEFNLIDRENSIDSDGDWIRIRNIQCFQKFSGELKSKNLSGKDICLKMTSNNYEEKQFILCDINSNKGILYIKKGTNWIKNSNKMVNVPSSSKKIRTRGFNLPSESLLNNIDLEEIIESFSDRVLDTLGLERDDFSKENYNSLMAGIIYAVDQNIMFGAVSFVTGAREDDDNYFFMLGKTSCDIFCIGLFVKSGATLSASAASSFTLGGGLAALGLATSETGLGFIVGEGGAATLATAGTIELLGATTLSFMATRSSDILIKDRQKFAKIERKVVEETVKVTAGKKFKDHFIRHKGILENALGKKYPKFKTHGGQFLDDIGKIINDGTVRLVGKGTLKKGQEAMNIYRGNGMTVVIKISGEFVTLIKSGEGMDLAIKLID